MITSAIKKKIQSITSVFETSSKTAKYDALTILPDGPKGRMQITFGAHQTTEFGNLKILLKDYIKAKGKYALFFEKFMDKIGVTPLHGSATFRNTLRLTGKDPIMQQVQDAFFDRLYWTPAYQFFQANGFTLPLSMLVIYDSYIHSGGVPAFLRDDFKEVVPAKGGEEKAWLTAYVNARDLWLEKHPNKILNNTDYRTDCFIEEIKEGNWTLDKPVTCKYNSSKVQNWITV